jgi:hypothetical protein
MDKKFIWLCTYTHRHGTDVYPYSTEEKANAKRIALADEWFDLELSIEKPEDPTKMADLYWTTMEERDETFDISQVEIDGE